MRIIGVTVWPATLALLRISISFVSDAETETAGLRV